MNHLIYINKLGLNSNGKNTYELYFSDEPDFAWGIDWECKPASVCNLTIPDKSIYELTKTLETELILNTAQNNSCFSMQDCKDGIIPLAWECIDDYEEYPKNRIILPFGMPIEDLEYLLSKRNEIIS